MGLFTRKVITSRDDAALVHEDLGVGPVAGPPTQVEASHDYDGEDGNSTPNGGR